MRFVWFSPAKVITPSAINNLHCNTQEFPVRVGASRTCAVLIHGGKNTWRVASNSPDRDAWLAVKKPSENELKDYD